MATHNTFPYRPVSLYSGMDHASGDNEHLTAEDACISPEMEVGPDGCLYHRVTERSEAEALRIGKPSQQS